MKVLVTGANGFVGRHLCAELVRRGVAARGTVRAIRGDLPETCEVAVVPDISETELLARALDGVSHVVHLAARVHVMRETVPDPLAAFRRVNVEGTANVLAAAERAGVERLVLMSSIRVNGAETARAYEDTDVPAPVDPYGVSKFEAENHVADTASLDWAVLRPPLVYGAGVGGNFRRLLSLARLARLVPLPLGRIDNRRSLVGVQNLVDAIIHILEHPSPLRRRFLVSDGEDVSTSDLIRRLGHAGGHGVLLVPCPVWLIRNAAAVTGRDATADRLLGSLAVTMTALRKTGWEPPVSLDAGLAATVRWWRKRREARIES